VENEKGSIRDTHFDTEVTSVDIVSKEEVAGLGGFATDFEEFHEIKLRLRKLSRLRQVKDKGMRTYWPWMSPQTGERDKIR